MGGNTKNQTYEQRQCGAGTHSLLLAGARSRGPTQIHAHPRSSTLPYVLPRLPRERACTADGFVLWMEPSDASPGSCYRVAQVPRELEAGVTY